MDTPEPGKAEQLGLVLQKLKTVLLYRLDFSRDEWHGTDIELDEDLFFEHLFVSIPAIQRQLENKLIHYSLPVLLLGKQGIGKTTILESTLREIERRELPIRIVRIRCTGSDREVFSNYESIEGKLKASLLASVYRSNADYYDLVRIAVARRSSLFESDSMSSDVEIFFNALHEVYARVKSNSRFRDFFEWLEYACFSDRDSIADAMNGFANQIRLGTLVDLVANQLEGRWRILFVVDNVESLREGVAIQNALRFLVRLEPQLGSHGSLVVAARPKSHSITFDRKVEPLADKGSALFDTVDFSEHLVPLIFSQDDSSTSDTIEAKHISWYWSILDQRLAYLIKIMGSYVEDLAGDLSIIFRNLQIVFTESPRAVNLVAGVVNHSCRSFLVTIVNYIEYLIDGGRPVTQPESFPRFEVVSHRESGIYDPIVESACFSDLLYFAGLFSMKIRGLDSHRLRPSALGRTDDRFRFEELLILRFLDGCDLVTAPGVGRALAFEPTRVGDIVSSLDELGSDPDQILESINNLASIDKDEWELQCLEVVTGDNDRYVVTHVDRESLVKLEPRGWVLGHVFPFHFHYLRGELDQQICEASPHHHLSGLPMDAAGLMRVIEFIVRLVDFELAILLKAVGSGESIDSVLAKYCKVIKVSRPLLSAQILHVVHEHLKRFKRLAQTRPGHVPGSAEVRSLDLVDSIQSLEDEMAKYIKLALSEWSSSERRRFADRSAALRQMRILARGS